LKPNPLQPGHALVCNQILHACCSQINSSRKVLGQLLRLMMLCTPTRFWPTLGVAQLQISDNENFFLCHLPFVGASE
jgi:hypothetical protein